MSDNSESEQQEMIKLQYSKSGNESLDSINVAKDIDLAGLRKRIWDDQDFKQNQTNEQMISAMKIFRPPYLMPMEEHFSDEAKIKDILQIEDFSKVYELFIALQTASGNDQEGNDDEFYIESEGEEPKQIIVGTKESYKTFEVDQRGKGCIKLDKVVDPKASKAFWKKMGKEGFCSNKIVRYLSLIIVDKQVSRNGEIAQYRTIQYSIPGTVDIKIHKDSAISLYEKDTLKNRHDVWNDERDTEPKFKFKIQLSLANECETFDAKNENFDEAKASDDDPLYIESEKKGEIIIGTNEHFKTVSIDARGGLYKLKKNESLVAKTIKKASGNKFNGKSLIVVLETTPIGNRGDHYQYDTLEYSIPVVSDIKIHEDKSITLFRKDELSKGNFNPSIIAGLNLATESNSDEETSSASPYVKIKTEHENYRKWTAREAKRDTYIVNHSEKTTANQKGTVGDVISIANGVLGLTGLKG